MRTTLTIDDDLLAILRREAKRKGMSLKELINAALRRSLAVDPWGQPPRRPATRSHSYQFRPGIDPDKMNQLADELEAEEFARGHREGR
jgi:hypothetical protein